jgi:hypothetical protein
MWTPYEADLYFSSSHRGSKSLDCHNDLLEDTVYVPLIVYARSSAPMSRQLEAIGLATAGNFSLQIRQGECSHLLLQQAVLPNRQERRNAVLAIIKQADPIAY